ncbi:ABC transporter ATP-binding protein [Falsirhodobacter sp. 20TX0035]|uniref:ABC transporter ATP-binding protein n=1 Tax=Falsirhodobacter sp. 20TX0035 TaxID=3022019 RepID=UPI00232F7E46|nr:ABC transporter ATP-binding protein [Falsirhodobacter sp. 20TX0035]MDB6453053.1 ABC transporter ATP-binding protein [Falsirhodobacter sp. 20TX0035]
MSFLTLSNLQKSFGGTHVVRDFRLEVERGEFISLLGPSGCGKTTVLRMVGGFEVPDAGIVSIDGRDVTRLGVRKRDIGMVFQSYALFPNLTVAQNVGFGLRVKGTPTRQIAPRVAEMLDLIGLPQMGDRYPWQLSGGQQQRVALARALAPQPKVLLLDEPLSALDAKIRVSLRNQIRDIQRKTGITTIFVTHDQEEALSLSDRVVVMHGGVADQIGTPFDIYNHPTTRFVAGFVGTLNTLEGLGDGSTFVLGPHRLDLQRPLPPGPVTLGLRPEMLQLDGGSLRLPARVTAVDFLGSVQRLRVEVEGQALALDRFNDRTPPPAVGSPVTVGFHPGDPVLVAT